MLRDSKISFKKRIIQIYRDKISFILEVLCPIILTLIGCLVGSIEFLEKNRSFPFHLNQIDKDPQTIYYSYINNDFKNSFEELFKEYSSDDLSNIEFEQINYSGNFLSNIKQYLNNLYNLKKKVKKKKLCLLYNI